MGIAVAVIVVVLLTAYVIGIFVLDHQRRKKGKPSLFADECEHEGKGKRLVREFRKTYKK